MSTDRFKFRVFDKETGSYSNSENWYIKPDGTLQTLYFGEIWSGDMSDRWEIERCTGLKDRDGNLIYEGDIILSSNGSNYSVEYDLHYARFLRRGKFNNAREFLTDLNSSIAEKFLRVIGNIHENPELLEGKQ